MSKRRADDLDTSESDEKIPQQNFSDAAFTAGNLTSQSVVAELKVGDTKTMKVFEYEWDILIVKSEDANSRDFVVNVFPKNFFSFNDEAKLKITMKSGEDIVICKEIPIEKQGDVEKLEMKDLKELVPLSAEDFCALVIIAEITVTPTANEQYITDTFGTEVDLTCSDRAHDIILVLGDKKYYALISIICTWSEFFNEKVFFGEWCSKPENEFVIEDMIIDGVATPIDPHEFETLLLLIHPNSSTKVNESNVVFLLKLAAHFKMASVLATIGILLKDFDKMPSFKLIDRLVFSDKYNLASLQLAVLEKIRAMTAEEADEFRDENKAQLEKLSDYTLKNLMNVEKVF